MAVSSYIVQAKTFSFGLIPSDDWEFEVLLSQLLRVGGVPHPLTMPSF